MVEFALVSLLFFSISLGAIDIGRAVFMYSQMTNAVRDAARVVKVYPGNGQGALDQTLVETYVYNYRTTDPNLLNASRPRPGMSGATVTYSCSQGCQPTKGSITINASLPFTFLLPKLLGINASITMTASATEDME